MPTQILKLFYKGSKLSTVQSGSTHYSIVSANNQNLCETNSQTKQTQLLATDAQASTVTVHAGSQTAIAYSPYGDDSLPAAHQVLSRFTGQTWLPSAIGYLLGNGHRLFNVGLMRFHSADSLSPFEKGGINAYAYCTNDPVNRSDPSGMFSIVKLMTGGYSSNKISHRLNQNNPNLTSREYKILQKHIATQKAKGAKETKSHSLELREKGDERILNATLKESILTSLTPVKINGKTRYIGSTNHRDSIASIDSTLFWKDISDRFEKIKAAGRSGVTPTSPTFSSMLGRPSSTWPRIRPPSQNSLDFTGNYIDKEVEQLRNTVG
ncbi:RHS repeat-associated core domain-containing protein [Pseudomonas sp. SID14000]|uniref:RHS repeat-associated core domain-containing protein n=1 Tax=Pseudomonas sp. SID14000 TaxID=1986221 RepID=UPI000B3CB794|nr:RHS repeat-associated core domain-containing protein [Pseudomonas sp. SID14000]